MTTNKHVAPHRWADLLAGSVTDQERDAMTAHAASCEKCGRAKTRIQRASNTFPSLRQQATPELPWDSVRARVHWAVSKAKRESARDPSVTGPHLPIRARWFAPESYRRWPLAIAATAVVAVGGYTVYRVVQRPADVVAVAPPVEHAPIAVTLVASPLTAAVSRLSGDVMIDGARISTDAAFAKQLGAGTVIATADGRIDLQFGSSTFALGPHSELELASFDSDAIQLNTRGTIDLEVSPRAKHQRFVVVAGDKTVEVRGTRFTVKSDHDGTLVECQHGLVAVRDATGEIEVGTARKALVTASVSKTKVVPLTADELAAMTSAAPWAALGAQTAPLTVSADHKHAMRIDGVEVGAAPFTMRTSPGRHTIEAADRSGKWRKSGWVDVKAGSPAHFDALEIEEPIAKPTEAARKQELSQRIDRAKLRQCTRRLEKSGLTNTFVQIEITVDAQGQVDVLNVLDTDLPSDTTQCIHDAIAQIHFAPGAGMTWREKLTF